MQNKSNQPTSRGRRNSIAISPSDQLISIKHGAKEAAHSPDVTADGSGLPKDAADAFQSAEVRSTTMNDEHQSIKSIIFAVVFVVGPMFLVSSILALRQ